MVANYYHFRGSCISLSNGLMLFWWLFTSSFISLLVLSTITYRTTTINWMIVPCCHGDRHTLGECFLEECMQPHQGNRVNMVYACDAIHYHVKSELLFIEGTLNRLYTWTSADIWYSLPDRRFRTKNLSIHSSENCTVVGWWGSHGEGLDSYVAHYKPNWTCLGSHWVQH